MQKMLISKSEMEMLQLIGTYKDCPARENKNFKAITNLLSSGYLRYNKTRTSIRVSRKGYKLLERAGIECRMDIHPVSDKSVLVRRHASAEIALLFQSIQIDVCKSKPSFEIIYPEYIASQAMRRQFAANVLGMSKFSGILYTTAFAYVTYNIGAPHNGFYPNADESVFRREIIRKDKDIMLIYFGKGGYVDLVKTVTEPPRKEKYFGHNYSSAYDEFSFPVSLVPLSKIGALQMGIMLTKNYRESICRAMLGISYQPVAIDWVDALHGGIKECFIVLFDLNFKRLEQAMKLTSKLNIIILSEQYEALEYYLKGRTVEIYQISIEEVMRILAIPDLPDRSTEPFITNKGGGINIETPEIKTYKTKKQKKVL